MLRPFFSACILLICFCASASGQAGHDNPLADSSHGLVACGDSPTPGKRPATVDCATLARKQFTSLPKEPRVLRLEVFPSLDSAQRAATPASTVIEAADKIWLVSLAPQGEKGGQGKLVAEIGPLPQIAPARSYELFVAEADFGPDMKAAVARAVHTHPGPEIFYLFTGEQCLETPAGIKRARAGESMIAPANTPMQLNIMGSSKRDGIFVVIHDSQKPAASPSNWSPKGTCSQLDKSR